VITINHFSREIQENIEQYQVLPALANATDTSANLLILAVLSIDPSS